MRKTTKLYVLLGVLLVVCVAAFAVSHYEEKKEEIKTSGEAVLEINPDSVTWISWTNSDGSFSFTKEDSWSYDGDQAFPVDSEKIEDLLSVFEKLSATFTIESVSDFSQYGLDDPVCSIDIISGDDEYFIKLGDFSKMDQQRYASIGDGNAYLLASDPCDEFDAVLSDMVLDDSIPEFDIAEDIQLSGIENYTITRDEKAESICEDDVYYTAGRPLDSDNVDDFVSALQSLSLDNYASYNVSDDELAEFGMNDPELTIEIDYIVDEKSSETGNMILYLSRNPEELEAYNEAVLADKDSLPDVTCYARLGQSQLVYEITQSEYDQLTDVSYDSLRHQQLCTMDFDTVSSIDIVLDGKKYTFSYTPAENKNDDGVWSYNDKEFDISSLKSALLGISAVSFTDEADTRQREIALTLHMDNDAFPSFELILYRNDGASCIASVDGSITAFVSRTDMVDIVEAVNEVIL